MELSFASLSNSAGRIAYALLAVFLIRRGPRRDADRGRNRHRAQKPLLDRQNSLASAFL